MTISPFRVAILFAAALLLLPACGGDDAGDSASEGGPTTGYTPPYVAGDGVGDDLSKRIDAALASGRAYMLTQQQDSGGIGFPGDGLPGMTTMGVTGLIAATPKDQVRDDPAIRKALDYLVAFQNDVGAVVEPTGKTNYITSVLVSALSFARISSYTKNLVLARDYIERSQISGDEADLSYGGFPYKQEQGQPADLSNGQFAFEALKNAERAGQKADPQVWERGQAFLARVHNRSETNTRTHSREVEGEMRTIVASNDGGGVYYPGESKAGMDAQPDGTYVLRSYGSMTYALLKCLLFTGVEPSDARLEAVIRWVQQNWTVEKNPGFETEEMSYDGYFYYLYTATRALAEYEKYTAKPLVIRDANGQTHDWRVEIAEKILSMQQADGSWMNGRSERWDEKLPALGTGYMLQALAFTTGRLP